MKMKNKWILIAALAVLVFPIFLTTGSSQAAFLLDDGAGLKDNGQWQVIDPGTCLSNPAQTTRAACNAEIFGAFNVTNCAAGTWACSNAALLTAADCVTAGYNWAPARMWATSQCVGNWASARVYGASISLCSDPQYTGAVDCTVTGAPATWDAYANGDPYFAQSQRVQCLHCHNDQYGTHSLLSFADGSSQDTYFRGGHKNVLRKITDLSTGGPNKIPLGGPAYTTNPAAVGSAAYTNVTWATGMMSTETAYYLYNGYFTTPKAAQIKQGTIVDATTATIITNYTGGRSCLHCHTSGFKNAEARYPLASETMQPTVTSADALAKFELGITCVTCHKGAGNEWADYAIEHHTSTSAPDYSYGNWPMYEEATKGCMACHRMEDTSAAISDVTVQSNALLIEEINMTHSNLGAQFLQSPHAKFTGTYAQIEDFTKYSSTFTVSANGCSNPAYKTAGTCTPAGGTWGAVNHNEGCAGCHNPHVSAVDPNVMDPTNALSSLTNYCTDCHANSGAPAGPQIVVADINHPTGANTPLSGSAAQVKDVQMACVRCHMGGDKISHFFKVSSDVAYSTLPVQCSDPTYVSQNACTSNGQVWTPATVVEAIPAASGFAELDLSWACGWCHIDAAKVGADKVFNKTQMAAYAKGIHNAGALANSDCLTCHSTAQGTKRAVNPGTDHHIGTCTTCHPAAGGHFAAAMPPANIDAVTLKPSGGHNPLPYWSISNDLRTACLTCHATAQTRSGGGTTGAIIPSATGDNHHGGHSSVPGTSFGGVSAANGSRGDNDPGMLCLGCHGKATITGGDNTTGYTMKIAAAGLSTSTVAAANGRVNTTGLCEGCHEVVQTTTGFDGDHHPGACISCHVATPGTPAVANGNYAAGVGATNPAGGVNCTLVCHNTTSGSGTIATHAAHTIVHNIQTISSAVCETCHVTAGIQPSAVTMAACATCHAAPAHTAGHAAAVTGGTACTYCHTTPGQIAGTNCGACHAAPGAPVANFTATPDSVVSGLVHFNAAPSTCPTGATCSYAWDWTSDGINEAAGITADYTFTGSTTVKLTVTASGGTSSGMSGNTSKVVTAAVIVPDAVCDTGNVTYTTGSRQVTFTTNGTVTLVNWGDTFTTKANPVTMPATHLYNFDSNYAIRWTLVNTAGKETQCGPVYAKVSAVGTKHKVNVNLTASIPAANYTATKVWLGSTVKANGGTGTTGLWTSGNLNSAPGYVVQLLKYGKTFSCTGGTPTGPGVTPAGWIVDLSTADATLTCTMN